MPATTATIVDWAAAGAAAAALAPPGPPMTRAEIDDLVAELRECASLAVDPVAETAERSSSSTGPAGHGPTPPPSAT
jgi:hypothetical protein